MAIHYDKAYNAKIAKEVKNFNTKVIRAQKQGFKNLPDTLKVSDLKFRFSTRKELNKQLDVLRKFSSSKKQLAKRIENQGGASAIEWEWNYLKSNVKGAIDYYKREYETISKRVGDFPGERTLLDNIAKKISTLQLEIDYMSQSQFNSLKASIDSYMKMPARMRSGYRGFLSEVEIVMSRLGYDKKDIDRVFNELKQLTPYQFHQLYQTNDLIRRVYELIDSPIINGSIKDVKLTTDEDNASEIVEALIEEIHGDVEIFKNL